MKRFRWVFLTVLSVPFLGGIEGYCMETDNLTGRHDQLAKLADSTDELDAMVNFHILLAIQETNANAGSCDRKELIRNLRYELDRNPVGEVERFGEFDPKIKRYLSPFSSSIYGKLSEVSNLTVSQKLFPWTAIKASSIRVNQQIIGTDKLGHFFSQGYEYLFQKDWHAAVLYGMTLEEGIYGIAVSGVYSNGDLNANFNGYRFWKNVTDGNLPYVACVNGRYVQKKKFTWKTYVDAGWDEGINCSDFASKEYEDSVKARERANGVTCPAEPEACEKLVRGPCAFYLVSDACFKAAHILKVENQGACARFIEGGAETGHCQWTNDNWSTFVDKADEIWGTIIFPTYGVEQKWQEKK